MGCKHENARGIWCPDCGAIRGGHWPGWRLPRHRAQLERATARAEEAEAREADLRGRMHEMLLRWEGQAIIAGTAEDFRGELRRALAGEKEGLSDE